MVCVECLIGKQKKPILFKVTEPSSVPYRAPSACAKRAAYPDPPPVIPTGITWGGLNLGSDGFWKGDYGWGGRIRRPFGARGRSSIRYGTRLGDLKENWFLLFSNSTLNTHCALLRHSKWRPHTNTHTHTAVCLAVAGESILQREKQEEVRTHAPDSQTADRGSN